MIPDLRDIILADERIRRVGYGGYSMSNIVHVWDRDRPWIGPPYALDRFEALSCRPLSALLLELEFENAGGRYVQTIVTFPEYLIHGIDDNGERRR